MSTESEWLQEQRKRLEQIESLREKLREEQQAVRSRTLAFDAIRKSLREAEAALMCAIRGPRASSVAQPPAPGRDAKGARWPRAGTVAARILGELDQEGSATSAALAEAVGATPGSVWVALRELVTRGMVEKLPNGEYGLTEAQQRCAREDEAMDEAVVFARLAPDAVVPAQWRDLNRRGDDPEIISVKRLMQAVLHDAFRSCCRARGTRTGTRARDEARDWIFADDHDGPFSFVTICDTLGIDHRAIRRAVETGDTGALTRAMSRAGTQGRRTLE